MSSSQSELALIYNDADTSLLFSSLKLLFFISSFFVLVWRDVENFNFQFWNEKKNTITHVSSTKNIQPAAEVHQHQH